MFDPSELTIIGQALRRHRHALRRRYRELSIFKSKLHQCKSALHYVQCEELTSDLNTLRVDLQLLTAIEQKLTHETGSDTTEHDQEIL